MRNRNLAIDVLASRLKDLLSIQETDINEVAELVMKELPTISEQDAIKVSMLADALVSNINQESVEIVTTTPLSFQIKGRKTQSVVEEILSSAKRSITFTGYSISEYFEYLLKLIDLKSRCGVNVDLFINDYETHKKVLLDIYHKERKFFKVYRYSGNKEDKMASLHAKTIIVDEEKIFISSANLSYHGLSSNIEIGTLITSKSKAKQLLSIFSELKRQKVFVSIDNE